MAIRVSILDGVLAVAVRDLAGKCSEEALVIRVGCLHLFNSRQRLCYVAFSLDELFETLRVRFRPASGFQFRFSSF